MGWHPGQYIGRAWKSITGQYDPGAHVRDDQAWERQKQRENIKLLHDWAYNGQGPSMAQDLLERNRGQNVAYQLGAAKSMGGDPALANRNASEAISQGNADSTYQAALIRKQEQEAAMQQYIDAINQTRGQDIAFQNAMYNIGQGNADRSQQFAASTMKAVGSAAGGAAGA